MAYVEDEVYFRITYADPSMLYPKVEPFVFVGMNLSDEDMEDTWYFQFADSFAKHGSIRSGTEGDRRVTLATKETLSEMLDLPRVIEALEQAAERRSGLPGKRSGR